MKNRLITGILFIILGGLIAFGPLTIFPVCGANGGSSSHAAHASMKMDEHQAATRVENVNDGNHTAASTPMKDHWTARAELGIGILIALLAILLIVFSSKHIRLGISLSLALSGILAALIPTVLIGVCDNAHASCRLLTLPSLIILAAIVVLLSIVNTIFLYKSSDEGRFKT